MDTNDSNDDAGSGRLAVGRRRRATRTGTVLSQELIVQTAIRLLSQHGADALGVRRLGAALGADPSALYRYFHSTDELVLAVADELIGMSLKDAQVTGDWRADLQRSGMSLHRTYTAHPQAAVLAASRVTRRPNEMRGIESGLAILRDAGFGPDDAARYYHRFIDFTLGFAAIDAAAAALSADAGAADRGAWQATYACLPADQYPHIAESAQALAQTMSVSAYPGALEVFLDGLEAALDRNGR
ncbi:TetR/AcrR family transcriptional regulator [Streptomyces arenae]|uniref:TetR/AcrR family transcriptional regulator n=1 Tax=Streptomyces arenae TaxID=29301 RepID=UPI002657E334|nr:TetR/AcrR family transcriptional regulator [Streptomyces arenae]MCG7205091.1 TetR/AcrR family transcriptional regulator [Streptomyces arenae]